ncbi:hypothetical protein MMC08_009043, partial [Hypocenomyce scalaris]|nr:hypothetical protein [Hypocenomyce scalaris]
MTRDIPAEGIKIYPINPQKAPKVEYAAYRTYTSYIDCHGCALETVMPRTVLQTDFSYVATTTAETMDVHELVCRRSHPHFHFPTSLQSPTSASAITTQTNGIIAPDEALPNCTSTAFQYIRRPTRGFEVEPEYASTETVTKTVDCHWCELQLETRFIGPTRTRLAKEPATTVTRAVITRTQTVCSRGERVHTLDGTIEYRGAIPSSTDDNADQLDLHRKMLKPPPCQDGHCNAPTHLPKPTCNGFWDCLVHTCPIVCLWPE